MNTINKILQDLTQNSDTLTTDPSEKIKKNKVKIFSRLSKKSVRLILYFIIVAVSLITIIKISNMNRQTPLKQTSVQVLPEKSPVIATTPTADNAVINNIVEKSDARQQTHKKVLETPINHFNTTIDDQKAKIKITTPPLTKSQKLITQYNESIAAINRGDIHEAISLLQQIINNDPDNKDARLSLIAIFIQQHKINAALEMLQSQLTKNPKDADYAKLYAYTLIEKKASHQALQILIQAQPDDIADHTDYFALMASLYLQQQDYYQAKHIYQQLIHLNPQNSFWWVGLGIANDKLGMTKQASDAFVQANRIGELSPSLQRYINKVVQH